LTARKDQQKKMTAAMHTDLWDRTKHNTEQVDLDCALRRRIRGGEDVGDRNPDADGLSGEETGVIFRLVNTAAIRRTGEFIFSFFSFSLCSNIFCEQLELDRDCCPRRFSVFTLLVANGSNTGVYVGMVERSEFSECKMMESTRF
jgi:hypothetical protein